MKNKRYIIFATVIALCLSCTVLSTTAAETCALGDVNHDGCVTAEDAELVLNFAKGTIPETSLDINLADVDGDGQVTEVDAVYIDSYAAGTLGVLPAEDAEVIGLRKRYICALPEFGDPDENYGKVHFTPLYYPDGDYVVEAVFSDCWTPAGMISCEGVAAPVQIEGNAYDDWSVGHN